MRRRARPAAIAAAAGLLWIAGVFAPAVGPRRGDGVTWGRGWPGTAQAQAPEARWSRHPFVQRAVRAVEVDGAGVVWARSAGSGGASDAVVAIGADGRTRYRGPLEALIETRFETVRRLGSVADLWAVDPGGRVWLGPRFHDGSAWTVVARDGDGPLGRLRYDGRAFADADGQAWVPFTATRTCPGLDPCDLRGLRAFTAAGQRSEIMLGPAYEADGWGVADVHLQGAGDGSAGFAARAASRLALYLLPAIEPIPYPFLGPPANPGDLRNAGYATAAAGRPDGRLQVFTWVELQLPEGAQYRIFANTWHGGTTNPGWGDPEDLADCPLVGGGARDVRIVAAAWGRAAAGAQGEALWLASSAGGVAQRRDGRWPLAFTAREIGLGATARIRDLAVGPDGTLWLAADDGLYAYGSLELEESTWRVHFPLAVARSGR